jgi:hypothetical protein
MHRWNRTILMKLLALAGALRLRPHRTAPHVWDDWQ